MGLQRAGAPGTTAALALLNDQVKKGGVMASSYVGGLSGAFIPVSEDQGMIHAVEDGALTLEKLEAMAKKKRESIKARQEALKKDTDTLKDIEAEIEYLKGENFRRDINKLNLTDEEYERFRKCVLTDKSNLLEVLDYLSQEQEKQEEGDKPLNDQKKAKAILFRKEKAAHTKNTDACQPSNRRNPCTGIF